MNNTFQNMKEKVLTVLSLNLRTHTHTHTRTRIKKKERESAVMLSKIISS